MFQTTLNKFVKKKNYEKMTRFQTIKINLKIKTWRKRRTSTTSGIENILLSSEIFQSHITNN